MNNIWYIMQFTLREAVRKKTFIAFAIIMALLLLAFMASTSLDNLGGLSPHAPGAIQAQLVVQYLQMAQMKTLATTATLGMLIVFFTTIPVYSLLYQKGSVELLLSKPLTRGQFISGRMAGGVVLGLVNISFYLAGVFLFCGLQYNFWNPVYLVSIGYFGLSIIVIYSISGLLTVLSRSSAVALMGGYLILVIPTLREVVDSSVSNTIIRKLFTWAAYVIPDFSKLLGTGLSELIARHWPPQYQPIITALSFSIVIIGAMILIYEKKDL